MKEKRRLRRIKQENGKKSEEEEEEEHGTEERNLIHIEEDKLKKFTCRIIHDTCQYYDYIMSNVVIFT